MPDTLFIFIQKITGSIQVLTQESFWYHKNNNSVVQVHTNLILEMRKQLVNTLKRTLRRIFSGSIQKRLGHPKNAKLLIIHADDFGMSASENRATIEAMEKGMVNSASIMVPCPNFNETSDYSKIHPEADLGIHLTLTSEWPSYKWKPVLSPDEVGSIIDLNGSLLARAKQISENAIADEVEKEFRAQINKAIESGIDLTHIDTHMFTAFTKNEIIKKYISMGKEFMLPVLLTNELPIRFLLAKNVIIVDQLYYAQPEDNNKGLSNFYRHVLESIKPGLNCILLHVAYNNKEMQDITGDKLNYGSAWRQADFDFFTGNECRQLVENNKIQLITWREIRDKLIYGIARQ